MIWQLDCSPEEEVVLKHFTIHHFEYEKWTTNLIKQMGQNVNMTGNVFTCIAIEVQITVEGMVL